MAWTKTKTAAVVAVGIVVLAGTAVTIQHLKTRDGWRVPNVSREMVQDAAPQVRIMPTKYPGANNLIKANTNFDKFVGINVSVADMVGLAYRGEGLPVPPQRLVFSGATPQEKYDFAATLPKNATEALKRELKTRLGFVARRETRDSDTDVLVLKIKRPDAPQLKPTTGEMGNITGSGDPGRASFKCDNQLISTVASVLSQLLNAPVVDQTGLTGQYTFELVWKEPGAKDPDHRALKEALLDQIGLELAPGRAPVEMLVVEKTN